MAMSNDWVEFWREHSCGHGCPLGLYNRVIKSESRNSKQIRMIQGSNVQNREARVNGHGQ
jgi:hypothetical protein